MLECCTLDADIHSSGRGWGKGGRSIMHAGNLSRKTSSSPVIVSGVGGHFSPSPLTEVQRRWRLDQLEKQPEAGCRHSRL